ncbi:MAG: hypothetical protein K2Q10_02115, partial [Rhodospirillales bacterium]|nr:hypothetical protein [Rhodospirillales bacterium]
RRFLTAVLEEPLNPGGTLAGLGRWTPERRGGIGLHIAKTGTSSGLDQATLGAMILGGVVSNGRAYTYLVLAAGLDQARPLGTTVTAADFTPLAELALEEIAALP